MHATSFGYKVLLVEDNAGDSELIQQMMLEMEGLTFQVQSARSLLEAMQHLAAPDRPDLILLDLFLPDSQGLDTFARVFEKHSHIPIIVLTGLQSDTIGVEAVSRGAQDFLVKMELSSDQLARSARFAIARRRYAGAEAPALSTCRSVGFVGVKGGVGTTSLACCFASRLKRQIDSAVLALDLELESGALGFLLQATSSFSLADAVEKLHQLDQEYWRRLVSPGAGEFDVLQSPASVGRLRRPTAEAAACVFRFARTQYQWIVADLGRYNEFSAGLAIEFDTLVLVTSPDLLSLRATKKVYDTLVDDGFPLDRIRLVENRAPDRHHSLIADVTGQPAFHTVPELPYSLTDCFLHAALSRDTHGDHDSLILLTAKLAGLPLSKLSWVEQFYGLFHRRVAA